MPSAAAREGHMAVLCVTPPAGHETSAMSHATSGGLLRYGVSPSRGSGHGRIATVLPSAPPWSSADVTTAYVDRRKTTTLSKSSSSQRPPIHEGSGGSA